MTTEDGTVANGDGKVGFRDIYRAVNESEARLTLLIQTAFGPVSTQLADHEKRLREVETTVSTYKNRVEGAGALLSTGQKIIVTSVIIVNLTIAVVTFLTRGTPPL